MSELKDPAATKSALERTKIRIIEDADATGETAVVYDEWRAAPAGHRCPAS